MNINRDYIGCFGKLQKGNKANIVVIHHTVTASSKQTRRALKSKNCSTHFEIDKDGTIYQYAELNEITQHCGSNNFQAIGVDVTHITGAEFTDAQMKALHDLCCYISNKLDIPFRCFETIPKGFYFHRAIGSTACPDNLSKDAIGFSSEV